MGSLSAITGLVGTGVSAGSTAAGAYGQSQAYKAQGQFSRSMGNLNANMTDMQATDAIRRGNVMANRQGLRTRLLIGQQRATAAAQGVDVNSGSALDLQANAARMGVIDANTLKMNAYKEAMGLRMEGSNQRFRGQMAYMTGRGNATNSLLAGGMSAARQVSSGLDSYYRNKPPLVIPSTDISQEISQSPEANFDYNAYA